jgi:Patched family
MVILALIWQLTFFIACIVIDEKRIQNRRRDCCLWIQMKNIEEYNNDVCEYNKAVTEHKDLTYRCVKWFAEHLLQPKTQVCVIIVFLAFAGLCGWSSSQFEQNDTG